MTSIGPSTRVVRITLWVIALVFLAVTNNINWGGAHWRSTLQADAKGYYAYLPALFIHHDLHFGFLEEAERTGSNENLHFEYRVRQHGVAVNKYWSGTALLQSPFFLVAHAAVRATGGEANGYGKPYVMAICIAAVAYALLGLWALDKILISYGIGASWRAITLVALAFGTHLFYYVIVAPGMSHVYSFALLSLLFLVVRRGKDNWTHQRTFVTALLLGALCLVRPVNGIAVLAFPFLLEGWTGPFPFTQRPPHVLGALLAWLPLLAIPGLQLLLYKLGTGHWWVDTYPGESFNWSDPHGLDILFSYKKGLFLYTPLCFVALLGLYHLGRRSRFALWSWGAFFLVLVYVLSSWWNWWYGGSFSARPFVEYLPLFAIPLALALQGLHGLARRIYVSAIVFLVMLCQVQTYQARYYRIHYEDMDRDRYWDEFLRLDKLP